MLNKILERSYKEYHQDLIANKNNYKMDDENFRLWISYLETHPKKATYEDYKRFKLSK